MHIKINEMPKVWPIAKKAGKRRYLAVPSHATSKGISLLFILRDVLKIAKTRKEVRFITLNGEVKVNNKIRKNENFPVQVFDKLSFEKAKKYYALEIVNKKYTLTEITAKEAEKKVVKISGKKILEKNKIQMNLEDGQNFLTKEKFSVGDSALINTKENKIEKILPLKEGANIEIIAGKHAGETGKLIKFVDLARGRDYVIKLKEKEVSLPYKTILVIA